MTRPAKFVLRIGCYGLIMGYLLCDLYFFSGPLSRCLKPTGHAQPTAATPADAIVARVGAYDIHRSQLERALRDRLWSEGKSLAALDSPQIKLIRYAALNDLIDHELLRNKTSENAAELKVSDAEINAQLSRFSAGFTSKDELTAAMTAQGITSDQDLRTRLAAHIQQGKYVASRLAPLIGVTDAEARQWFEKNQDQLATPERLAARHIFLPTLERDPDAAQQILATALAALTAGTKDFATLARELSEDPLTNQCGGTLGWMTRLRLPAGLATQLFAMPLHQPALLRSNLGWHLIEVTARLPESPATFDQAKPDILIALQSIKRQQAATAFRDTLRRLEAPHIQIYHARVEE